MKDLVRRLEQLAKKDPATYSLGKKTSKSEVANFEARYRITLPDQYREFLLAAGQGASGPDYGLLDLDAAMAARGTSIYELADEFPAPQSSTELLDFNVGGILPIQYSGCSYYAGIVTTGPERGQIWLAVEERPGWVPHLRGELRGIDGKPFESEGATPRAIYDAMLAKPNAKLRTGFAQWYADWLEQAERAVAA